MDNFESELEKFGKTNTPTTISKRCNEQIGFCTSFDDYDSNQRLLRCQIHVVEMIYIGTVAKITIKTADFILFMRTKP